MNDNALIALVMAQLNSGLASIGQGSIIVQQDFQPTNEGVDAAPTIFLHKVGDELMGASYRNNLWNPTTIAHFTGSVTGSTLTVSAISSGSITSGQVLQGTGIPDNIQIVGVGANNTFTLTQGFTVGSISMTTIAGMGYTESQQYLTTFQFSALATQDPSNVNSLTASDILNYARAVMQSLAFVTAIEAQGVGVLRIGAVRNPYFDDDRSRWEACPSFDLTFTHKQLISSVQPIVTEEIVQILSV